MLEVTADSFPFGWGNNSFFRNRLAACNPRSQRRVLTALVITEKKAWPCHF